MARRLRSSGSRVLHERAIDSPTGDPMVRAAGARVGFVRRPCERKRSLMVSHLIDIIDRVRYRDDAQGLAEYALILALIAIVAIIALIFLGNQISDKLSTVGNSI
jgi:pilus assembly protein Flp/PilA